MSINEKFMTNIDLQCMELHQLQNQSFPRQTNTSLLKLINPSNFLNLYSFISFYCYLQINLFYTKQHSLSVNLQMNQYHLDYKPQIYELKDKQYELSFRDRTDPAIGYYDNILPYVRCHQLHGSLKFRNVKEQKYYPIQILPQQFIGDVGVKLTSSESVSLFKSSQTAESQIKKNSLQMNYLGSNGLRKSLFNGNQTFSPEKPFPKQSNKISYWNSSKNPSDEVYNLRSSSFISLQKLKASQISSKMDDIPLGYEQQTSKPLKKFERNLLTQLIQLPPLAQHITPLMFKNKLTTLFQLKNSQSKDDLYSSQHMSESGDQISHYFNFGKITQSNITNRENTNTNNKIDSIKKSQQQKIIQKFTSSTMYNSVIQANDKEEVDCQVKGFDAGQKYNKQIHRKLSYTQNDDKISTQHNKTKSSQLVEKYHQEQNTKVKYIRGLKKSGKTKVKNQCEFIERQIQTPKFGNKFVFNFGQ